LEKLQEGIVGADPQFLDVLAAAYAEAGQFDKAVLTAKRAHRLAEAKGLKWSQDVEARASAYEMRKPYHEPANTPRELTFAAP
jgi:hypothetical protein